MVRTMVYKESFNYANVHTMTYYDLILEKGGKVKVMINNRYYTTLDFKGTSRDLRAFTDQAILTIDADVIYLGRNL